MNARLSPHCATRDQIIDRSLCEMDVRSLWSERSWNEVLHSHFPLCFKQFEKMREYHVLFEKDEAKQVISPLSQQDTLYGNWGTWYNHPFTTMHGSQPHRCRYLNYITYNGDRLQETVDSMCTSFIDANATSC